MSKGRHLARELAVRGLYQWRLTGYGMDVVEQHLRSEPEFDDADTEHLLSLLHGVQAEARSLEEAMQPLLDRPVTELSPVERSILLLGAFELQRHPEIPYRVVINEAVELAKVYGGTDGYKYVNGVLDKLARQLRPAEAARRSRPEGSRG